MPVRKLRQGHWHGGQGWSENTGQGAEGTVASKEAKVGQGEDIGGSVAPCGVLGEYSW